MKWIETSKLSTWASQRIDARDAFATLLAQLVRASVKDATAFRFPNGNNAQIQGWDGQLIAQVADVYKAFVPEGASVWEWGVDSSPNDKAQKDWKKRLKDSGDGIKPEETTFVFATPHKWPGADKWIVKKKKEGSPWKDVRVLTGVNIEDWAELCPAASAQFAKEHGFFPKEGAESIDEFWDSYATRFKPTLSEQVVLAGRADQSKQLLRQLNESSGPVRCKGDSLDEVVAFVAATIRTADPGESAYFLARTLIVDTESAAKQLSPLKNLAFVVRGGAAKSAGLLSADHPVVIPMGRESIQGADAINLTRPIHQEMSDALMGMGLSKDRATQLAHECGRSVSILSRRIANVDTEQPAWRNDKELIGKANSRGVTSRGVFDGGKQERVLAEAYRADAAKLDAWPRTRTLILGLADHYDRAADDQDLRVEQQRLRE